MAPVSVTEARSNFSRLVERARTGERIVIAKAGVPVAELGPLRKPDLVFGGLADLIQVDYEAFDAADAEIAAMWDFDSAPG